MSMDRITRGSRGVMLLAALALFISSQCAAAGGVLTGTYVELGGGWGKYGLETLNDDFIGRVGSLNDVFEEETGGGPEFYTHVGYFIIPNLSLSGGFSYMRTGADHEGTLEYIDIYDNLIVADVISEMTVSMFALELKSRLYMPLGNIRLFAGGTLAWCHGKVDMDIAIGDLDPDSDIFTGDGFGFGLLGGLSARLAGPVSMTVETGYRHYGTGTLTDSSGDEWNLDILDGAPGVDLGFNGFYGVVGLTLDLGI